jgi:sterol desaturase/sphingolipid hydroxylase (fatty acid hydroxylase superfamily)
MTAACRSIFSGGTASPRQVGGITPELLDLVDWTSANLSGGRWTSIPGMNGITRDWPWKGPAQESAMADPPTPATPDQLSKDFGMRDEKGHWRPPYPVKYAPLFVWPPRPLKFLKWLFGYPGFLWPINTFFIGLACLTWFVFQPSLGQAVVLRPGWILLMLLRNMALLWIVSGSLHLTLYTPKLHGSDRTYHPQWQAVNSPRFLFRNQVFDNVFCSCVFGCTFWTAYEVLYTWGAANAWWPYLGPARHPVLFVALFLLIPLWRETHFHLVHRLIDWRPLMTAVHRVHHMNPNPGPWAGLAMHPVESLLYFSVVAIHFIVPSHPPWGTTDSKGSCSTARW